MPIEFNYFSIFIIIWVNNFVLRHIHTIISYYLKTVLTAGSRCRIVDDAPLSMSLFSAHNKIRFQNNKINTSYFWWSFFILGIEESNVNAFRKALRNIALKVPAKPYKLQPMGLMRHYEVCEFCCSITVCKYGHWEKRKDTYMKYQLMPSII